MIEGYKTNKNIDDEVEAIRDAIIRAFENDEIVTIEITAINKSVEKRLAGFNLLTADSFGYEKIDK
ncbi:MAG TPA: hypothetical protein VIH86_10650 [Puia sp.]